jgi:uncharacterized LabA/DUF88 family protein
MLCGVSMSTEIPFFIKPTDRTYVFIDGPNFYATVKAISLDVDYKRMLQLFRTACNCVAINYYTATSDDQEYSSLKPLIDWLDYNGYNVITKPTKEFTDSMGRRRVKGNMDLEIAVDVLRHASHANHIILCTGDGDFRVVVEAAQKMGCFVTVISTMDVKPPLVADELRRQASQFVDIVSLRSYIERDQKGRDAAVTTSAARERQWAEGGARMNSDPINNGPAIERRALRPRGLD